GQHKQRARGRSAKRAPDVKAIFCRHRHQPRRLPKIRRWQAEPLELLRWEPMIDYSIPLKYNPQHRTNIGRKVTPAVRVYRSDPEGITLQIWHEHEYMSAWLSFADALALADAICEAAKTGAQ